MILPDRSSCPGAPSLTASSGSTAAAGETPDAGDQESHPNNQTTECLSLSLTRCLTTFTSLVFAHDEGKIRSERLPQTGTEGGAQGLLKEQWVGLLTADQSDGSTEGRGMGAEPETRERGREE